MSKSASHSAEFEFEDTEHATPGDILDDLRAVVRDAESLLRATEGQVGEHIAEVRSRIEGKLADAKVKLHEAGAEKAERVKSAARSTDSYVRENPWTAVAIAAGVGFLIGAIGVAGRRR
jgi:ElaB/YqjD/DUF883 family membrane-anchored ribosome-binding protein